MAKSTKTLSGQSQRKFFRDLFRAEPGVAPEAADRLTEACAAEIAHIRVRLPLAKRRPVPGTERAKAPASSAGSVTPAAAEPIAAAAPFDPNAFSLIVLLRKHGKDALLAKLHEIGDAARLRDIAKAQHVAVDPAMSDVGALAEAIVSGTEKRVASRQAAAS